MSLDALDNDGLSIDLIASLEGAIRERSLPRKFAATACGVSPKTFERWIRMGETGTGTALHTELARRVHLAEAEKIGHGMTCLAQCAYEDGKAARSYLELFKPGDFGGPARVADEFESLERHKDRRHALLTSPPPRMLAEFRTHGWWQFPGALEQGDRETLEALSQKYRTRALVPPPGASKG